VEATKFAFAKRTDMGDWSIPEIREHVQEIVANLSSPDWSQNIKDKISDYQTFQDPEYYGAKTVFEEDHGTCHHCFLSPEGDAVSVTASVNLIWGCKFMSPSTGIIMNNQMDDFASPNITSAYNVPPAPNNFISPGKRPMSSMSTTIVVDEQGRVVGVVGASGGTKIISAVAQVLLNVFYLNKDVKAAVDARRLHHQLFPMNLGYEDGTTTWLLDALRDYGHNTTYSKYRVGGAAVQAIIKDPRTGSITANADFRKRGEVDGF
jgi:gamma-glutamyltranspeptidase/glutathione hydrolase/leukotriene-C4 hydrolase